MAGLPPVVEPGTVTGQVQGFGLTDCRMVAGTTDGCASFLATGAAEPGDGVSALGTTLTVKLLSDRPIFAPEYGIYSHRLLGQWLAGGASNSGGAALLQHFTPDQMATLSARIEPETDTGLDLYPLPGVGERFPIADPQMQPRLTPRPADDATFLHALFEGVAGVGQAGPSGVGRQTRSGAVFAPAVWAWPCPRPCRMRRPLARRCWRCGGRHDPRDPFKTGRGL